MRIIPVLTAALVLAITTGCTAPPRPAERSGPRASPFADFAAGKRIGAGNVGRARVFNLERDRLGEAFEAELLAHLAAAADPGEHYWVAHFLMAPYYLEGRSPRPRLAQLILQQALALCTDESDIKQLGQVVKISVTAAVNSKKLGLGALAEAHKRRAESLVAANPILAGYSAIPQLGKNCARKG